MAALFKLVSAAGWWNSKM